MKTESEYLFVIVKNRIGMVRKDSDGFTAVPCSDDGNHTVPFSGQDSYWKQWALQTNFTARRNRIDFAFVADCEDCQICSEELEKTEFKRVDRTVWNLKVIEDALRFSREKFNLHGRISLFENGKCVKTLNMGSGTSLQTLYLTRYGDADEDPLAVVDAKVPVHAEKKQRPIVEKEQTTTPEAQKTDGLSNADSYNDPKALSLKVGDKIEGTVTSVLSALNRCYIKSDKAEQLIRVKLSAEIASLPKKEKDKLMGKRLIAEVVSVKDKRVDYLVAF